MHGLINIWLQANIDSKLAFQYWMFRYMLAIFHERDLVVLWTKLSFYTT